MTLKECPFCKSTDLKHYANAATDGNMRGVVVCRSCGARLEAYNRDYRILLDAGYSWKDAKTYQRGLALDAVADKWNNRPEPECHFYVNNAYRAHVCESCGERFEMPSYYAITDDCEISVRPMIYCPHCGKKVVRDCDGLIC